MLAEHDLRRLRALIEGSEHPDSGIERHFLRVIRGDASPCSPVEREWLKAAMLMRGIGPGAGVCVPHDEAIDVLRTEIERRDVIITGLRSELAALVGRHDAKDQLARQLCAKVSVLEGCLEQCHMALAKYEKSPPLLVTDTQKENERLSRRAAIQGEGMVVYSSTTGQD